MRPRLGREDAMSPVASVLLVAITVILATTLFLAIQNLRKPAHVAVESGAQARFTDEQGYLVEPTGPSSIPVAGSNLYVTIDGVRTQVPLSALAGQLGGATEWAPGTPICIVGPGSCYRHDGQTVAVEVYSRNEFVFRVDLLRSQAAAFTFNQVGGGITVNGNRTVGLLVAGSAITCGANGPTIPVTVQQSVNGGSSYTNLFGGAAVNPAGGQTTTYTALAGSVIGFRATASGGGCSSSTYDSFAADPHVRAFRKGDAAPNVPAFGSQQTLEAFMAPYVNTQTQTMVLDPNQIIILWEFVSDLGSPAADYQDLVIVLTFT